MLPIILRTERDQSPHLQSKSEWRKRGFKLKKNAKSVAITHGQRGNRFELYHEKDTEPIQQASEARKVALKKAREKALTCIKCGEIQEHHTHLNKHKTCHSCVELEWVSKGY